MDGVEKIIQKILSEADEKINEITLKANTVVNEKIKEAEDWAKDYTDAQTLLLSKETEEIVSRRLTVADLDVRKALLEAKSKVIDKTFSLALEKLLSLSKKEYLAFVEKLLCENAEEGDQVLLAPDGVITDKDVKGLKVYTDRKLKTAVNMHNGRGGVYLVGDNADKDLTFSAVLDNAKGNLISKVAISLFGEN